MVAVNDNGQRIHTIAINQDVQTRERRCLKSLKTVIERCIAAANGLQSIEEVQNHLSHGNIVDHLHLLAQKLKINLHTTLFNAQRDGGPQILLRRQNRAACDRLTHDLNVTDIG